MDKNQFELLIKQRKIIPINCNNKMQIFLVHSEEFIHTLGELLKELNSDAFYLC